MVQLFVRLSSDPKEWSLVELQGQVETRDSIPLSGMHIGNDSDLGRSPHLASYVVCLFSLVVS